MESASSKKSESLWYMCLSHILTITSRHSDLIQLHESYGERGKKNARGEFHLGSSGLFESDVDQQQMKDRVQWTYFVEYSKIKFYILFLSLE